MNNITEIIDLKINFSKDISHEFIDIILKLVDEKTDVPIKYYGKIFKHYSSKLDFTSISDEKFLRFFEIYNKIGRDHPDITLKDVIDAKIKATQQRSQNCVPASLLKSFTQQE